MQSYLFFLYVKQSMCQKNIIFSACPLYVVNQMFLYKNRTHFSVKLFVTNVCTYYRKALQVPTQSIACANAKHCKCHRKALQVPSQSIASAIAKVCVKEVCISHSSSLAKYFQSGAAIIAWWNSSFFSIRMTSSRSRSTILMSSDSSRCCDDTLSTPLARKV